MEYRIPAEASTTVAVVAALSRYEDVSRLAVPPLHDSIPTDALDELFDGKDDRRFVCLSFTHVGDLVTIENGEKILIEAEQEVTVTRCCTSGPTAIAVRRSRDTLLAPDLEVALGGDRDEQVEPRALVASHSTVWECDSRPTVMG